jgi:quercetin dioxygenase-like cupin family protein
VKTLFATAAILACCASIGGAGQQQPAATDPVRTPIMQNETLAVTHLRFGPGTREPVHTHPFPIVLVQINAGEIAVQEQNQTRRGNRPGEVWYVPAERPHSVTSQGGATAIDMLAIALLPNRPPAPAAPPTDAPAGVTRVTLVDNADMRVVRVRFTPGSREPMHAHPNDLLTVQVTRGNVEIVNGPDRSTQEREPGFVQFLPRNVQHAYTNADTKPFELISIAVK